MSGNRVFLSIGSVQVIYFGDIRVSTEDQTGDPSRRFNGVPLGPRLWRLVCTRIFLYSELNAVLQVPCWVLVTTAALLITGVGCIAAAVCWFVFKGDPTAGTALLITGM